MLNDFTSGTAGEMSEYERRTRRLFEAYDDADLSIFRLQVEHEGDEPRLRDHAGQLLGLLIDRTATRLESGHPRLTLAGSSSVARPDPGVIRSLDARLLAIGRRHARREPSERLRWLASVAWLVIAVGAAGCIAKGWWLPATVLLVGRVCGSVWVGNTDFPVDGELPGGETPRARIERCLLSHIGDAATLIGVTLALIGQQRTAWAAATVIALSTMLFASLARTGALQVGVLVRRSVIERVARRTSVIIAVGATGLFQSSPAATTIPLLGFAGVGALLYAVVELVHVHRMLGEGNGVIVIQRRNGQLPIVLHQASPANDLTPPGGELAGLR